MFPALLLVSCSLAADTPPAPAPMPAPAPAPVVVATPHLEAGCSSCGGGLGGGCATGICGSGQDPDPMEKKGLFAKLKKACKKPFTGLTRGDGCGCGASAGGLFGKLRGGLGHGAGSVGGCGCGTSAGHSVAYGVPGTTGCALPPIPGSVPPAPPAVAPTPLPAAPAGESKPAAPPATSKISLPAVPAVPAPMPAAASKPAF